MNRFVEFLMLVGALGAAVAVGLMCAVCLVVWWSGGPGPERSEAWREADEL